MNFLGVIAISLGSIGLAWSLRELVDHVRHRPGRPRKCETGLMTRTQWPQESDQ